MFAIIESGSKQYKVSVGDFIDIDKAQAEVGEELEFDVRMTCDGDKVEIGKPTLDIKVKGKIVDHHKAKKIMVFKYKAKKNYRVKQGHRQPHTKVEIMSIG